MLPADEEDLRQVVGNLLDNAVKYTPTGGRVDVSVTADGREVVLEVRDTGIGIEPRDRDRVFERFYRVDKARSRELEGTGLGLAIVKHLVLKLGGRIALESTPAGAAPSESTCPSTAAGSDPASEERAHPSGRTGPDQTFPHRFNRS